ncbi:hypothetical protein HNR51_004127 [Methylorubrum thiocyanatum]|uniref:Uncharacterized protein n=1 Tax=Methylorubrum thiocyanatum TaxID=47958 RepID=A0AA40VDV6_9HYPH|nr:hypothetical protein [Methylorubrum thiocyanatum]GJE79438.1 hypothetical protein CJNNKLLH_0764 [Methylorubrum thiocyanatum]
MKRRPPSTAAKIARARTQAPPSLSLQAAGGVQVRRRHLRVEQGASRKLGVGGLSDWWRHDIGEPRGCYCLPAGRLRDTTWLATYCQYGLVPIGQGDDRHEALGTLAEHPRASSGPAGVASLFARLEVAPERHPHVHLFLRVPGVSGSLCKVTPRSVTALSSGRISSGMKGPRSAMSSAISCMTRSQKLRSPEGRAASRPSSGEPGRVWLRSQDHVASQLDHSAQRPLASEERLFQRL